MQFYLNTLPRCTFFFIFLPPWKHRSKSNHKIMRSRKTDIGRIKLFSFTFFRLQETEKSFWEEDERSSFLRGRFVKTDKKQETVKRPIVKIFLVLEKKILLFLRKGILLKFGRSVSPLLFFSVLSFLQCL